MKVNISLTIDLDTVHGIEILTLLQSMGVKTEGNVLSIVKPILHKYDFDSIEENSYRVYDIEANAIRAAVCKYNAKNCESSTKLISRKYKKGPGYVVSRIPRR